MKRHMSFLMLLARSTVWKLLAIFVLMTAAEFGLAVWRGGSVQGLEQLFRASYIRWVFAAAVWGVSTVLYASQSENGGKLDYTIRRLRIGHRTVFAWQCAYSVTCLLILWGVQLLTALALCRFWLGQQEAYSPQALYLAFYRSEFLHALLPLDDWTIYVRNIFLFTALGISCTGAVFWQRQGKNFFPPWIAMIAAVTAFFPAEMASVSRDMTWSVAAAFAALLSVALVFAEEGEYDA